MVPNTYTGTSPTPKCTTTYITSTCAIAMSAAGQYDASTTRIAPARSRSACSGWDVTAST